MILFDEKVHLIYICIDGVRHFVNILSNICLIFARNELHSVQFKALYLTGRRHLLQQKRVHISKYVQAASREVNSGPVVVYYSRYVLYLAS